MLRKSTYTNMPVLLIAVLGGLPAYGQTLTPDISVYKLDPAKMDVFRLFEKGNGVAREVTAEPVSPPIAEQLTVKPYAALIQKAASAVAIDPALVHAVIQIESRYNAKARSPKGAVGLMQLLPETAARYGVSDPGLSPEANVRAGTRYLSDLMKQFGGRLELVVAAYNAGENAVVRYGFKIPPYPETQRYVPAVIDKYKEWTERSMLQDHIQYVAGTRLGN